MDSPDSVNNIVAFPHGPTPAASSPAPARFGHLLGTSARMQEVYQRIARVAPTATTVLIVGESGSGKELVARTIHERSAQGKGPLIAVNCGAIPANLIEAELFGHEKGAFTGAERLHRGCFERARGGTLFLDEVTEMTPQMQVRLLRVLETGRYARVGGEEELRAEARVVAATNRVPRQAAQDGRLREDLLYRLAVFQIVLPALRERDGDAELLAEHFLRQLNEAEQTTKYFSRQALATIRTHPWPGNVRELQNAVRGAFIMAEQQIDLDYSAVEGHDVERNCLRLPIGTPLAQVERQLIYATLDLCDGNKRQCAERLGISLKTLYNRLSEYQSQPSAAALLP